jgi:hypothetical protein
VQLILNDQIGWIERESIVQRDAGSGITGAIELGGAGIVPVDMAEESTSLANPWQAGELRVFG